MPFGAAKLNNIGRSVARPVDNILVTNSYISTSNKQFGTASAYFDGSGDYIKFTNNNLRLGTGDFTIEFWYYMISHGSGVARILYDQRTAGSQANPLILVTSTGNINYFVSGANRISTSNAPNQLRTWQHLAVSRSSGTTKMFLNGTQIGSNYTDATNYLGNPVFIGTNYSATEPNLGYVDELRVSNTARYTANFTPSTEAFTSDSNTILLCHFNDYNGSKIIVDDIGEPITEGTRPALTATVAGNSQISTAQSKFGSSSALFDGTGDNIKFTSDTLRLATHDFTIEGWIRPVSVTGATRVFYDQRTTATQANPLIYINTNAALIYYVSGAARITSANNIMSADTWYHVSVSRSGTSTRMFVDGTQVGSTYTDSTNYTGNPIFIGTNYAAGEGWNTYIDEFRLSNIARYTDNFTPSTEAFTPDANTTLLLHFEGSNGSTTFTDSTS